MKKAHTLILAICLFSLVGCTNEETGIISEFGESSIKLNQASGAVRVIEHIYHNSIVAYTPNLEKFKNEKQLVKIFFEWGPDSDGFNKSLKAINRIEPMSNEETGIISEFGESSIKLNQASGAVRAIEHIHNIANYTPDLQKFKNENQRVKIIFEWGDPELAGLRENVKVIRRIEPLSKE